MNNLIKIARNCAIIAFLCCGMQKAQAVQAPGTWKDVTPVSSLPSSGVETIVLDPVRPNVIYANIDKQGTWRSDDFGLSFKLVSTGTNGNQLNGRPWFAAIDGNPSRDSSTYAAMIVTQGFGSGYLWKSTNGGVDWANIWLNNIYAPDGVTNISGDVGQDLARVWAPNPDNFNHLVAQLHQYYGTGGNSGVFESTNGGVSWIVRRTGSMFTFMPHSDALCTIDDSTWMVSHGVTYPNTELWRTTDNGMHWSKVADNLWINLGEWWGSAFYAMGSTDIYKTTDKGATWMRILGSSTGGDHLFSYVITPNNRIYVSSDHDLYTTTPKFRYSSMSDLKTWTEVATPKEMWDFKNVGSGWYMASGVISHMAATFDGKNVVIITGNYNGGVWRYVEPTSSTTIQKAGVVSSKSRVKPESRIRIIAYDKSITTRSVIFYDVKGQHISTGAHSRQVVIERLK